MPVVRILPPVMLAPVIDPVELIKPPVNKLPPVMLAVALTCPAVVKLPPVMLAVALTCPPVNRLPPVMLPETDSVPEITVPVELIVNTLAVPALLTVTLALENTLTLLVPPVIEFAL